jgi:hypothetical protein
MEKDDFNAKTKKNNEETANDKQESICIRIIFQCSVTTAFAQHGVSSLDL